MKQAIGTRQKQIQRWLARKYAVLIDRGNSLRLRIPTASNIPLRILVDSSVRGHSIVAGTVWVDTSQEKKHSAWPDANTGYWATKRYKPGHFKKIDIDYELDCLAALIRVAIGTAKVAFYTCSTLDSERQTQPNARYKAIGWFDLDLFENIAFQTLESEFDQHIGITTLSNHIRSIKASYEIFRLKNRLAQPEDDPVCIQLRQILSSNHTEKDSTHLTIAHKSNCPFFLTLDTKLLAHFDSDTGISAGMPWLNTKVLKPSSLAKLLLVRPLKIDRLIISEETWFAESGSIARPKSRNKNSAT